MPELELFSAGSRELVLKTSKGEWALCHCNGSFDDLGGCKVRTEAMEKSGIQKGTIEARVNCMSDGVSRLVQLIIDSIVQPGGAGGVGDFGVRIGE